MSSGRMSEVGEDLAEVIRLMVDEPEQVEIREVARGRAVQLELRLDPADLGKVIGRQGRTVRALRSLLAARSSRGSVHYGLEILD
jgi:predicted RNA-binding protein YlqC (UPF0109 family)